MDRPVVLRACALLLAAAAATAGCGSRGPAPNAASTGNGGATGAASSPAGASALVLADKTYPLKDINCITMDGAFLIAAKTQDGERVMVDTEKDKVEHLTFKAGGVDYLWETTSTGGAPDPVLAKNGKTYTVTGKIKQLHDATKLSDFVFTAVCPA